MSVVAIIIHVAVGLVVILSVIWCVRRISLLRMTRWDLQESMHSPVFIIRPDGQVLSYRNALYNTDKREVNEMYEADKNVYDWIDEASRRILKQSIQTVMHTRERQTVSLLFLNAIAHNEVHLIWYGSRSIAFVIDMPTVSQGELTRLRSEAILLNTMLDNLPVAILVADARKHSQYVIANKLAGTLCGTTSKTLLKHGVGAMPADMQHVMSSTDEEALRTGKSEHNETLPFADGTQHTLNIQKLLVSDAEGHRQWIITSLWDITQFVQQQQTLADSKRELSEARLKVEESNRLKEEFLRNMSVEIRNPLNVITGFSSLLVETEDAEQRNELAHLISSYCKVLMTEFDDMLEISKIQSGNVVLHPREVDLNLLVEECLGEAPWADKPQLSYSKLLPKIPYRAMLDLHQVRIILRQIINNAIKFTDEGSIEIRCEAKPNAVRFIVSDTGIGIAPEHLSTVFDRFQKAGSMRPGVGLGLTISKALVELMMGDISITSEPGRGTVVTILLPSKVKEAPVDESSTLSRFWNQITEHR